MNMGAASIESDAFERAALRSESYRIQTLLGLLGVLLVYAAARGLTTGEFRLLLGEALLLGREVFAEIEREWAAALGVERVAALRETLREIHALQTER